MIIGIGNDKIDIRRIAASLERFGPRFFERIYTPLEQAKAQRRASGIHGMAPTLAKRFAAKEACAKALGTGIAQGVFWRDMGVVNLPSGQPTLQLTGGAAARLAQLLAIIAPAGHVARVHIALTDDFPWAEAQVIIEAVPMSELSATQPSVS